MSNEKNLASVTGF